MGYSYKFDGLVQERRNSSALAMELRLFCTYPSTYSIEKQLTYILETVVFSDQLNQIQKNKHVHTVEPVKWDQIKHTKTYTAHNLPGVILMKSYLLFLAWKTNCLELPLNLAVVYTLSITVPGKQYGCRTDLSIRIW